jgi:hypothetical protein
VVVPDLIAFWEFLGREFALEPAQPALRWLREFQPSFLSIMNDPSRFGMAKSMVMQSRAAGFDMSDPEQMRSYFAEYNARVESGQRGSAAVHLPVPGIPGEDPRAKRNQSRSLKKRIAFFPVIRIS